MSDRRIGFKVGDQAWELDLGVLTLNDQIVLQRLAGHRRWRQMLLDFDDGDAEVVKVLLWAARRAAGETVTYDDPSMNPRARDLTWTVQPADAPAE